MPQWDFLDFLAAQGKRYPAFTVLMHAEATGLIEEGGKVVGVRATVDGRPQEIRADLVVGADGRHSTVRDGAGFDVQGARRADGRAVVPPHATSPPTRPRPWAASIAAASW